MPSIVASSWRQCHTCVPLWLFAVLAGCTPPPTATPSAVTLPQGSYAAAPAQEGVLAFLGMPYALAPTGARRWREAEPLPPGTGRADATAFGPSCRQRRDSIESASLGPQSEDCLSINVWTRGITGPRRPVLVWIHGGANVSGGAADPLYNGQRFVRDNEVVLVSFNYRLGPFGFLDLADIGGPAYARSRNIGLLDQLAALRWVRQHIGAFGGDSANITVFGESAGGSAVMRLMAMPLAAGLFDKAIVESGGPANIRLRGVAARNDVATSRALTPRLMTEARTPTLSALQALPGDSVLAAAERVAHGRGDALAVSTWGARADGEVLPEDIFGDIRRGAAPRIPLLIGTNEDEMLYFRLYDPEFAPSLMREYHAQQSAMGRSFAPVHPIADAYIAGSRDPMRYVDFAGEFWLRQPSILFAEGQAAHADVYMYLFAWDSGVPGLGACHALELPFVFGWLDRPDTQRFTGPKPPTALARRLQAAWTAFATTGSPSRPGETPWPRYTADRRATLRITDSTWTIEDDPKGEARRLLRAMYDVR